MEAVRTSNDSSILVADTTTPQTAGSEIRRRMSYEEFLALVDEDQHAEWIDGEAIIFMPPETRHQRIVKFLLVLLDLFVEHFNLGEVLQAPFEMKASPEGSGREPDLLFVAREHRNRLTDKKLVGPADLIIEVISPESVYRDRIDKFDEYEAAGVREYWLVDARPGKENASFWVLDLAGKYRAAPIGEDGVYRSTAIPNFWFNVNWLWEEQRPSPLIAFAQIANLPHEVIDILQRTQRELETINETKDRSS
jgi:Uma2 family endonuclease